MVVVHQKNVEFRFVFNTLSKGPNSFPILFSFFIGKFESSVNSLSSSFFIFCMKTFYISCIESRLEDSKKLYARFKIGPCEQNQTLTIANNLRRALLSELDGIAITAIKIYGVKHEYCSLQGIRESILDILFHFKKIVLTSSIKIQSPHIGYLNAQGPKKVTAEDIVLPSFLKCVNSEQLIATLAADGKLRIVCFICPGKNFWIQSDTNQFINHCSSIFPNYKAKDRAKNFVNIWNFKGTKTQSASKKNFSRILPIDAIFMPIDRVHFTIEADETIATEQVYEHIFLEVSTNGSIHPIEAIEMAAGALIRLFEPFQRIQLNPIQFIRPITHSTRLIKDAKTQEGLRECLIETNDEFNPSYILDFDLGNLNISLRSYFSLKKANIQTIRDLLEYSQDDLLMLHNFSASCLKEVEDNLFKLGFFLPKKEPQL